MIPVKIERIAVLHYQSNMRKAIIMLLARGGVLSAPVDVPGQSPIPGQTSLYSTDQSRSRPFPGNITSPYKHRTLVLPDRMTSCGRISSAQNGSSSRSINKVSTRCFIRGLVDDG